MTKPTIVINREDAQKEVEIVFTATGVKDSVFIQPMSKAALPAGSEVTAAFLMLNPLVKVITPAATTTA